MVLPIHVMDPRDKHAFVILIHSGFLLQCINTNNFIAAFVEQLARLVLQKQGND